MEPTKNECYPAFSQSKQPYPWVRGNYAAIDCPSSTIHLFRPSTHQGEDTLEMKSKLDLLEAYCKRHLPSLEYCPRRSMGATISSIPTENSSCT